MSFFARMKNFMKKNWTFTAVVVVPILRFMWRLLTNPKTSSSSKKSPFETLKAEGYKKGDVIDVQVKK